MTDLIKPTCDNCGSKSFRYMKRKGVSYCLKCGKEKDLNAPIVTAQ